jgi:predicted nucleic acid-binding protein
MARVYLDTSFVSACVTTRDDPASIVRRETSTDWMRTQSGDHRLFVSAEVVNELNSPAFRQRDAALKLLDKAEFLPMTDSVAGVATIFVDEKLMPTPAKGDALHVAACTVHRVDYLLTWNVRHLANPNKIAHLRAICARLGLVPPTIITPDLLWKDTP